MLRATRDIKLPTTITGSLPRPSWYTKNIGTQSFVEAMVNTQFREQYTDTVAVYLHEQEIAGLDIVTDGDAHFDSDVGGQSWTNYPPRHMGGFDRFNPQITPAGRAVSFPPGHILHDYLESRVMPGIVGPVTPGELQYAAIWKVAQRLTRKPVKFGTIGPELVAFAVEDRHYKSIRDRILAIADALNAELHELADAGCPVIQFEEPQIHMLAARNLVNEVINPAFSVEVFNRTVKGLRAKTEVWCHTCWGNPSQQRMFTSVMSYKPALEMLDKVDADVITFESCSAGGIDLEAFGKIITDKKIAIGVIDHHTLQVERPEEIADHIRRALVHIPVERLVISSDCGMGREGMSRRHAFYKIVALVQGTNIVRRELGLPVADCLAADPHFSSRLSFAKAGRDKMSAREGRGLRIAFGSNSAIWRERRAGEVTKRGNYILDKSEESSPMCPRQADAFISDDECPDCAGEGIAWGSRCAYCDGTGRLLTPLGEMALALREKELAELNEPLIVGNPSIHRGKQFQ